jgi:TonB family protein
VVAVSAGARTRKAFAVSAAAHLLLLGALLFAVRPKEAKNPLVVRLLALEAPSVPGPVEATLQGQRASSVERPVHPERLAPGKPRSSNAARAEGLPSAAPLLPALAAEPAPDGLSLASALDEGEARSQQAPATEAGAASGGGGTGASLHGGRLGELHRRLAEAAVRCYPAAARRFRLRGEVPLHFCLDAGGAATALSLEGSTGSPLLDRSALECVVPGAQPLSGFEGCFLVPVRFGG